MLYNLVRVATATTGTGTITLGAAVSGCLSFADASVPNGAVVSYGISDGINSEVGRGTYNSGAGTLTRDTVLASTNSGAKINLSGTAQVYITALAEDSMYETATLLADHSFSGANAVLNANENQAFGDVCYINADGQAQIAKANAIATAKGLCMAAATINANANGLYLFNGFARDDSWNWTRGGLVYISVTGTSGNTLTQTAPTTTNSCTVIIGVATHADRIYFNPQYVIVEHV